MTIHIGRSMLLVIGAVVLIGLAAAVAGLVSPAQLFWLGLVLICPIAMMLMMWGMGHGESRPSSSTSEPDRESR